MSDFSEGSRDNLKTSSALILWTGLKHSRAPKTEGWQVSAFLGIEEGTLTWARCFLGGENKNYLSARFLSSMEHGRGCLGDAKSGPWWENLSSILNFLLLWMHSTKSYTHRKNNAVTIVQCMPTIRKLSDHHEHCHDFQAMERFKITVCSMVVAIKIG